MHQTLVQSYLEKTEKSRNQTLFTQDSVLIIQEKWNTTITYFYEGEECLIEMRIRANEITSIIIKTPSLLNHSFM